MSPVARLAAYAVVLGASLGAGAALGAAVGPLDVGGERSTPDASAPTEPPGATHGHEAGR